MNEGGMVDARRILLGVVVALPVGCGLLQDVPKTAPPPRCLNEIAWDGRAWTTLPERWVDDSFCAIIPRQGPSWRCAATGELDSSGFGQVSYRWAPCEMKLPAKAMEGGGRP